MDPIRDEHIVNMQLMADEINKTFKGYGFCLLVFDFGNNGHMSYISNAQRDTMIEAMKEFIKKNEGDDT